MGLKDLTMVRDETHDLGPKGLSKVFNIMNDAINHQHISLVVERIFPLWRLCDVLRPYNASLVSHKGN